MSAPTTIATRPADGAPSAPVGAPGESSRSRVATPVRVDAANPVAWVYAGLLVLGVYLTLVQQVVPSVRSLGGAAVLAAVLWGLYMLPWIVFVNHRELFSHLSRRTALLGLLWGAFVATSVMAAPANDAMISLYTKISPTFSANWAAAFSASWVEELSCGLGIVTVLYVARRRLRTPFEMMVLGAFVGLGFQILEDFAYAVGAPSGTFGQHAIVDVLESFFMRAFVAGWWSHTLWTALFGAGLGYLMCRDVPRKPAMAALLVGSAMGLHFLWDSPLLLDAGLVGSFVKGAVAVAVYVWAYRKAVGTDRAWVRVALAPEVANRRIAQGDVDALAASWRRRKQARRHVRHTAGPAAADAFAARQHALVELADALDDSGGADSPEVLAARASLAAVAAA